MPCQISLFLTLCFFFTAVRAGHRDKRNILNHIFKNYQKDFKPTNYPNETDGSSAQPNNVYRDIVPIQIMKVDTRNQIVRFLAWSRTWWFDERLYWNPSDFGNHSSIAVAPERIWTPDIYADYHIEIDPDKTERNMPIVLQPVTLENRQKVAMVRRLTPVIYKLACLDLVEAFPYDYVYCQVNFSMWSFGALDINLTTLEGLKTVLARKHPEWKIKDFAVAWNLGTNASGALKENSLQAFLAMEFILRRRPTFYEHSMLLPAIVSVQLSLFAMFLTVDSSGARSEMVNMGFITILGNSFLLIRIGEDTPKASNPEPALNILLLSQVIMLSVAITSTFALIYFQVYGDKGPPVPPLLAKLLLCQFVERKRDERKVDRMVHQKKLTKSKKRESFSAIDQNQLWRRIRSNLKFIIWTMEDAKRIDLSDTIARENCRTWRSIIRRLDFVLLTAFTVVHMMIVSWFMSFARDEFFKCDGLKKISERMQSYI